MIGYIAGSGWDLPEGVYRSQRIHAYEGEPQVGAHGLMTCDQVVLTAACGALNPEYKIGDLVVLDDVLTLFYSSHIVGPYFDDVSQPFDPLMRDIAIEVAKDQGRAFHESGTHAFMRGPHYESRADKTALRGLGADLVGMSILPELLEARKWGKRVLGLAVISNLAVGKHDHQEVLKAVQAADLRGYISELNTRLEQA